VGLDSEPIHVVRNLQATGTLSRFVGGGGDVTVTQRLAVGAVALLLVGGGIGFVVGRTTADEPEAEAGGTDADAALANGLDLHQQGRLDEAATAYRAVLDSDPENKYAYYNLGLIDQTQARVDDAIDNYRRAIDIDDEYVPALYNLGRALADRGDRDEAIDMFRLVTELEPENAGAFFNLGTLLVAAGRTSDGEAALTRAVTLDPSLLPTTTTLAS
jgi:tetratricopeptide (TPR) repeat protein